MFFLGLFFVVFVLLGVRGLFFTAVDGLSTATYFYHLLALLLLYHDRPPKSSFRNGNISFIDCASSITVVEKAGRPGGVDFGYPVTKWVYWKETSPEGDDSCSFQSND